MATSSNLISALGAGSGVDVKALAEGLVEAERAPQKERIDQRITKSEAKISGLGALRYALTDFRAAVDKLNDASDFGAPKVANSQSSALSVTASATAKAGSYSLEVSQLAQPQRSVSLGFTQPDVSLKSGATFNLTLSVNGVVDPNPIVVPAGEDTPEGVVDAINASGRGLTAQLIRTGEGDQPYSIVVTGQEGQAKNFSISSPVSSLQFGSPATRISGNFSSTSQTLNASAFNLSVSVNGGGAQSLQVSTPTPQGVVDAINSAANASLGLTAQLVGTGTESDPYAIVVTGKDATVKNFSLSSPVASLGFRGALVDSADARLSVNGLAVTRSSNSVSDLIPNVTLNLLATTTSPARVDLSLDTTSAKEHVQGLVKAYNDLEEAMKILADPASEVEGFGGALAGESLLRTIRNQIRGMMVADSSTPGNTIKAGRDVGLSFDRNGKLTLDEARLDKALSSNFSDVVQMFTAGANNKSIYSEKPAGLAGDLVVTLDRLTRSTGLIAKQTESASKDVTKYKADLKNLEERMSKMMERYTRQFSVMESLVGSTNAMKNSLKSSFEGMMAAYK